jgi:hypothetical protein
MGQRIPMASLEDATKDLQRAREENALSVVRAKLQVCQGLVRTFAERRTQPQYCTELRNALYYAWSAATNSMTCMVEGSESKRITGNMVEGLRVAIAAIDERNRDNTSLDLILPPIGDVVDTSVRATIDCHNQLRSPQIPAPVGTPKTS